jgi:hypothetical protein
MIAVSDTMAPPANGSMSILGRAADSHARMWGTSHVLPPGYRRGLRCGTCATLTAGMRLTGYGISFTGLSKMPSTEVATASVIVCERTEERLPSPPSVSNWVGAPKAVV